MYSILGASFRLPFIDGAKVPAGFASPVEDFQVKRLDVGELLRMQHPATFCMLASGQSMVNAGIHDGDLLIINRATTPQHGYVVLAQVDDGFTLKYLHKRSGLIKLVAANPNFGDIIRMKARVLPLEAS